MSCTHDQVVFIKRAACLSVTHQVSASTIGGQPIRPSSSVCSDPASPVDLQILPRPSEWHCFPIITACCSAVLTPHIQNVTFCMDHAARGLLQAMQLFAHGECPGCVQHVCNTLCYHAAWQLLSRSTVQQSLLLISGSLGCNSSLQSRAVRCMPLVQLHVTCLPCRLSMSAWPP